LQVLHSPQLRVGNSFNAISNCTIDGGAGATASPTVSSSANAIYSSGSATYTNKYNTIYNNNILDYFQASVSSNGILIPANSSELGNQLKQVFSRPIREHTVTTAALHTAINITSGGNFFPDPQ